MIRDDPGGWPIPSSVRYHALALSLRVGGGTILPTRRRRGSSTPAPVTLDLYTTDLAATQTIMIMEAKPTQYAMIMEAKPRRTDIQIQPIR